MGAWGAGLYQNDTSMDVKAEFEELINTGKPVQEITNKLTEDYRSIMGDIEEEPRFWLALADTQWELGVLLPDVKEKALHWIKKEKDMYNCQARDASAMRIKTLDDLQAKLFSPLPSVKRRSAKKRIYKCQWKLGDVFAYRLDSDLAKEKGLYGRYFLIQKIDEGTWYPGHTVPIVYVKITGDAELPSNEAEYEQLEFVQTWFTKYEERFWPVDMSCPEEDLAEKSKMNYVVDEYGFLPQYRVRLLSLSEKMIPSKLIYVGNFAHTAAPENEFVPHSKSNITHVSWKKFDETFETRMIKLYCGHNLREFSIYKE